MRGGKIEFMWHGLIVRGDFRPGARDTGPTYSHGGIPGDPADIEDAEFYVLCGGREVPLPDEFCNWLAEKHWDDIVDCAEEAWSLD